MMSAAVSGIIEVRPKSQEQAMSRPQILSAICLATCAACLPPPPETAGGPSYPEPGSGLSAAITANPLPVQMESTYVTDPDRWGRLLFDRNDVEVRWGSAEDAHQLMSQIEQFHRHWLDRNVDAMTPMLSDFVVRFRGGRAAYGKEAVTRQLTGDSRGERPDGHATSMELRIHGMQIDIEGDVASVLYRLAVHGGARWEFADLFTVLQIFEKHDDQWLLTGHTESNRIGFAAAPAVSENVPNRRVPFRFDFVYPVNDLARAIDFYTPLLGEPVVVTRTRASFLLNDSWFVLETARIDRRIGIKRGQANGYGEIEVTSIAEITRRLSATGRTQLSQVPCGRDDCLVTEDPSGNVVVWRQPRIAESELDVRPTVSFARGARPSSAIGVRLITAMTSWMATDLGSVLGNLTGNAMWVDDAIGAAVGAADIAVALPARWRMIDRGSDGLDADLVISDVTTRQIGNRILVTFRSDLTARGNAKRSSTALVMQLWAEENGVLVLEKHFMARARNRRQAMVSSMDYTAYPTNDLGVSGRYYKTIFGSEPYRDNNWFGFWSTSSVFGLVGPSTEEGAHRAIPHSSNGYADFSIGSAEDVLEFLENRGVELPVVPAINGVAGIDSRPGYRQILAVDSEGNLINFSDYSEY